MKSGRTHRVPLSAPAIKLLNALPCPQTSPYVFWAPRGGQLSDMSISAVCKRIGVDAVPHGMRSTAKDWAWNLTRYADEGSGLQLAHVNSDATRSDYARDELLEPRSKLLRDWAKYCATAPAGR